jgi:hypothetical protein
MIADLRGILIQPRKRRASTAAVPIAMRSRNERKTTSIAALSQLLAASARLLLGYSPRTAKHSQGSVIVRELRRCKDLSLPLRESSLLSRKITAPRFPLFLWVALLATAVAQDQPPHSTSNLRPILQYISVGWNTLSRHMTDCKSIADPKLKVAPVLYLPAGFALPPAVEN